MVATADFKALSAVVTRGVFARQVLLELGIPATPRAMAALLTVMVGEASKARYNPLATTRKFARATDFNSAGVKHYASLSDGIQASVQTLRLAPYKKVRAALAGESLHAMMDAWAASGWGTRRDDLHWQSVWADPAAAARVAIGQ